MRIKLFAFSIGFVSLSLLSSSAFAQDNAPPAQPGPAASAPAAASEKPKPTEETEELKNISIELNPLAAAIGRYSLQGVYLPARHHAITLNPFYTHAPVTVTVNGKDVDAGALNGFGGELGY